MSWREWSEYMHGEDTFSVLTEQPDPRGPSYGTTPQPSGQTFVGGYRKLPPQELYRMGMEETTYAYRVLTDEDLGDLEEQHIESPGTGRLNVVSSIFEPSEGFALIVGERES